MNHVIMFQTPKEVSSPVSSVFNMYRFFQIKFHCYVNCLFSELILTKCLISEEPSEDRILYMNEFMKQVYCNPLTRTY